MFYKIYFLPDYGILPDSNTDCSKELQRLFDTVEDNSVIHFKTGSYCVFNKVTLSNKSNVKLLGNRSKIISHFDPCGAVENNNNVFGFENCSDLEIGGLIFDTDAPIGAAGEVVDIDYDSKTVDVKIYDEFPVTGYEHFAGTNSFDNKSTPDYAFATYNNVFSVQTVNLPDGNSAERYVGLDYEVIGENTVRLKAGNALSAKEKSRLTVGHKINIRYEMYGNTVLHFAFCNKVLLKDILINSAASFGVTIEPRSSDFTFDNFSIRVKENSKALKAANADGIHILGLCGKLTLKNCNIEGLGDDTLNIHGLATSVTFLDKKNNTLKMAGPNGRMYKIIKECTWAASGDVISVYDAKTFLEIGSFTVLEQESDGTVKFKDLSGDITEGAILANKTFFASVHIDGCTLRSTRARGVLLQTHNVLIENSYIYGMSLPAILFAPDIRTWWEVGPCENVEIINNVIEYCATNPTGYNEGAIVFKASHEGEITDYPAGIHKNIVIRNNLFRDIPKSGIFISAAENISVKDNEFINCSSNVKNPSREYEEYDIALINCKNADISGNKSNRGEEKLLYFRQ